MKPLNYIKKYGLDKPHTKIRFEDIVEDFQVDFMALLEIGKARDNIKGYENAIRAMHGKFEGIENKSDASNRKAIKACWNKFYAVFVAPTREKLFPEKMRERREAKEQRDNWHRQQRDAYGGFHDSFHDSFNRYARERFWRILFGMGSLLKDPFKELGLTGNATGSEVKSKYRELALSCHPDKGGDSKEFCRITEAKNACLKSLGAL